MHVTARLWFTTCLLRHVYMPLTPLTLAWGWFTSGTLPLSFIWCTLSGRMVIHVVSELCITSYSFHLTHTHCMLKPTMCDKPMSLTIHFLRSWIYCCARIAIEILCSLILAHTCTLTHADILITYRPSVMSPDCPLYYCGVDSINPPPMKPKLLTPACTMSCYF